MDLSLHACQGCPMTISNRVENRNWLVLVSLTRWRTNRKIISVSNRPVSWYPMSQGAPVSYRCHIFTGSHVLRVPLPSICACATMSRTAGICHSYSERSPPGSLFPTCHAFAFAVLSAECSHQLPPTPSAVLSVPL